jgi:CubicO group peptidase (beta-lactamase class C family)
MIRSRLTGAAAALAVGVSLSATALEAQAPLVTSPFEAYLELLRQQAGIPGMSAAIVQNGEIVWERGFGWQNIDARIRATPDTPYPIADLTGTMAGTVVLSCSEQRRVVLDNPAARYGVSLPESTATVREVLNHTSAAPPGDAFHYDPDRYGQLSRVIESCISQPYRKTMAVEILERLAMKDSVPGRDVQQESVTSEKLFAPTVMERYKDVLDRVAVPYKVDKKGRATRSDLPIESLSASTGIVSTVRDLARFDAALDTLLLLREDTLAAAWSAPSHDNKTLPGGLGWLVQRYNGEPVVWQFGTMTNGYSSLILKLPAKHLTLILLANSDGLSSPFDLASGDVTKSLFAVLFLRLFG